MRYINSRITLHYSLAVWPKIAIRRLASCSPTDARPVCDETVALQMWSVQCMLISSHRTCCSRKRTQWRWRWRESCKWCQRRTDWSASMSALMMKMMSYRCCIHLMLTRWHSLHVVHCHYVYCHHYLFHIACDRFYKIGLHLSVCQCICPSASTLTVAFLDQFSPKLAQTKNPQKEEQIR